MYTNLDKQSLLKDSSVLCNWNSDMRLSGPQVFIVAALLAVAAADQAPARYQAPTTAAPRYQAPTTAAPSYQPAPYQPPSYKQPAYQQPKYEVS